MNVEQLDGFFAALRRPKTVVPSEYYREVFRARWPMPASLAASTKPTKF